AFLGLLRQLVELLLLDVRNPRPCSEVNLRHRRAVVGLLHRDDCSRIDLVRLDLGTGQLRRERHREATCMRRRDQLFGVRAGAVLKPRAEAVLRVLEDSALRADAAFAVLQSATPHCRCAAIHNVSPWEFRYQVQMPGSDARYETRHATQQSYLVSRISFLIPRANRRTAAGRARPAHTASSADAVRARSRAPAARS